MRAPRSRPAAGGAPAAGQLPTAGVSSAVRRAFNAALHPRDGSGRFRQTDNPQERPASRRRTGGQAKPRETVGQKALKTSGVTGNDTIEVLSNRVRKYKGFTTVESFVASHPKGRAYALRTLAADQKAGRIGFSGGAAASVSTASTPASKAVAVDQSKAGEIPAQGTAERRFHDGISRAADEFGPEATFAVKYGADGKPTSFSVTPPGRTDVISRTVNWSADDGERSVDHDLFVLSSQNAGNGSAKRFLAKSVEAYKQIDVDRVNVHASMSVGGYAWLKYGFEPDELSAGPLAKEMIGKADRMKAAGAISETTHAHLTRALNNHDFHAAVDIGGSRKVDYGGAEQSLGQHLFLGSDWTGSLNLRSAAAMSRFNAYVGKGA